MTMGTPTCDGVAPQLTGCVLLLMVGLAGCDDSATRPSGVEVSQATSPRPSGQQVERVREVRDAYSDQLRSTPGVVGTAIGVGDQGESSLVVYLDDPGRDDIPTELEGVRVKRVVTGTIMLGQADPTSRRRPVPMGFSVGHPDISAGTYGARVLDSSGKAYILSNNHVLADLNQASIGDPILQPGPADGGTDPTDRVAELADFEAIDFQNANIIDAAIAEVLDYDSVRATTPPSYAYGSPDTAIYELDGDGDGDVDSGVLGLDVQKYGRTSLLTTAEVEEIAASFEVCVTAQCQQTIDMEDQIGFGSGGFMEDGDSGALVVSDDASANPVALLAVNGANRDWGNRIDAILDHFSVKVISNLSASVEGPTAITKSDEYTWEAFPDGGYGPYTYEWYYRIYESEIDCDYQTPWYQVDTGKTYTRQVMVSDYDFQLRAVAQSQTQTASAVISVHPSGTIICPTSTEDDTISGS